ncbi:MAG: glycosyltransferase [Candidatus Stygibacter australis]|nr:glycosyltransferase [Candidatus Stygibacter australis]MDP8321393.1 glycosyltransferase [Candidatus Stygibacter australis]
MSIYFYSYPSLKINPGGPTYKTAMLHKHLSRLGMDVKLFNMWEDIKFTENDLFYIFTANISTYPLTVNLTQKGIKYIVNPIFYSNHNAGKIKLYRDLEKPFRSLFKRSFSDYYITETICRDAEKILPNTEAERDLLHNAFNLKAAKFQVLHNGVEKRFADSDPALFQEKYGLKDFVLYSGHLGPVRKNGLNIIKAMQKVDAPCVIIGDTLVNDEGKKCLAEIEKNSNITYLGWIDHNDPILESAYAACHSYILPTRYETPGRAALEAGLAGANIVITPKGGTKEYFAEHALYPDPLDVNAIAKSIEESLNKKKGTQLKERILKKYIWEVIAAQTKELIEGL